MSPYTNTPAPPTVDDLLRVAEERAAQGREGDQFWQNEAVGTMFDGLPASTIRSCYTDDVVLDLSPYYAKLFKDFGQIATNVPWETLPDPNSDPKNFESYYSPARDEITLQIKFHPSYYYEKPACYKYEWPKGRIHCGFVSYEYTRTVVDVHKLYRGIKLPFCKSRYDRVMEETREALLQDAQRHIDRIRSDSLLFGSQEYYYFHYDDSQCHKILFILFRDGYAFDTGAKTFEESKKRGGIDEMEEHIKRFLEQQAGVKRW